MANPRSVPSAGAADADGALDASTWELGGRSSGCGVPDAAFSTGGGGTFVEGVVSAAGGGGGDGVAGG